MKRAILAIVLALFAACPACLAQAERITDYTSRITVGADGWLAVTETITAEARGIEIKHGIYRDFPTIYRGPYLTTRRVPFEIVEVLCDGNRSPYHTKRHNNGLRLYIGSETSLIPPGLHTYEISYRTNRQVGFFDEHDELYWNVTGNGWTFLIEKATAIVTPPPGVTSGDMKLKAFTGPKGSKDTYYTTSFADDGAAVFAASHPLYPSEGLTIVVSWPKGFVTAPTTREKLREVLLDNLAIPIGLVGFAIIGGYFLWAWLAVGVDPLGSTVIPMFEPPDGVSPAGARFLRRMGFDSQCMSAAVISLAVKGLLTIKEKNGEYTIIRTEAEAKDLPLEETMVLGLTSDPGDRLKLTQTHHTRIAAATVAAKAMLEGDIAGRLFKRNTKYFVIGLILSVVFIIGAGIAGGGPEAFGFIFMCLWLSGWSVGVFALVSSVIAKWRGFSATGKGLGEAVGISILAVPFALGEIVGIGVLIAMSSIIMAALIIMFAALDYVFWRLIRAYTPEGRALLDAVEGFRMYLAVGEKYELMAMQLPEKTPALFEKYLAYAIALDVESQWAAQFHDVLERARQSGEEYAPTWYVGVSFGALGAAGLASSIGSSLAGVISSSSAAPGSSSGMGGGGSSGGGGGGGGGGGW